MQKFMCPRIRLSQTNGNRVIIPIDAISCISENNREKCVEVYTMDGFWYNVTNPIHEIDKKIEDAIAAVNCGIQESPKRNAIEQGDVERYDNSKVARFKRKRMLSSGVEKPARREAQIVWNAAQSKTAMRIKKEVSDVATNLKSEQI